MENKRYFSDSITINPSSTPQHGSIELGDSKINFTVFQAENINEVKLLIERMPTIRRLLFLFHT